MKRFGPMLLAAMTLSACGDGAVEPANMIDTNAAVENEADALNYQAEVIALPLEARQGVFLRAVRDAGLSCQDVTESEKLDDREGNPTWRAICDGRTPHIISITRDGTARIISRSDMG